MLTRVLLYGNDEILLKTRRWILEGAGFLVFTANNFGTAISLAMTKTFHVMILCQTLSVVECNGVLVTAREVSPSMRPLIFYNENQPSPLKGREEYLEVLAPPEALISTINRMVMGNGVSA